MEKIKLKGPEASVFQVPDEISKLRNDYISCLKLAGETDSKKEDSYLRAEAKQALDNLRKICPHQHCVCLRSEYNGSYSMDYDDHHQEHRICLCCGADEYAWNPDWKILTIEPFARFEGKCPNQIARPLGYLLSEATEIAETQGYNYFGHRR